MDGIVDEERNSHRSFTRCMDINGKCVLSLTLALLLNEHCRRRITSAQWLNVLSIMFFKKYTDLTTGL